jgi:hypothetical protein
MDLIIALWKFIGIVVIVRICLEFL